MVTSRFAIVLLLVVAATTISRVAGDGAGRSFPIAAENFAIDNFKRVNPLIKWDYTNFLVDLSGFYANCKALDRPEGVINVDRTTPDRQSVVAVVGTIEGRESDADSTTAYIEELIKRWMATNSYDVYISEANRFGCSVRPGCDGYVVVVCTFASGSEQKHATAPPEPRTTRRRRRPRTSPVWPTSTPTSASTPERIVHTQPPPLTPPTISGEQRALAFTPQQYVIAEGILGNEWDQSHYLENLSGFETVCSMVGTVHWEFEYVAALSQQLGTNIKSQYGYARNRGSTPDALDIILRKFTQVPNAKELGCSIIPDCIDEKDGQMYVVISCVYEE